MDRKIDHPIKSNLNPANGQPGKPASTWGFKPFTKYAGNPILEPAGTGFESYATYNPAAWSDGSQVYLLYRAEGKQSFSGSKSPSCIGLAVSENGINFERQPFPVLQPTEPYERQGGCEDPRLVRIAGTFYLTYTAYDGKIARLAMARSKDLYAWEKLGPVFRDEQWERFFPKEEHRQLFARGWSKSGAILDQPVNGLYWMYFGDTHIWAACSKNLASWEVVEEPAISPRAGLFDSRLVEPGPPPLLRPEGIWLGYNSADKNTRYTFAQALFDRDDPAKLLRRSDQPLLEPENVYETEGQVAQVVFGEGLVNFKGQWLLYYGMADSRVGVATSDFYPPES